VEVKVQLKTNIVCGYSVLVQTVQSMKSIDLHICTSSIAVASNRGVVIVASLINNYAAINLFNCL